MRISDWSSDVCSSDLADAAAVVGELLESVLADAIGAGEATDAVIAQSGEQAKALWRIREGISEAQVRAGKRSEEHTSELQSLMRISYAVFCLKKKKDTIRYNSRIHNQQTNIT